MLRGRWKGQSLDRITHGSRHAVVAVASECVFQIMPGVDDGAGGMKQACAWATPLASSVLHAPLKPATFHREYAQPVTAKIGCKQMAAARVEEQCMGMRRSLGLSMLSATSLLENAAWLAQAAVFRNGKDVVNCAAVGSHGEQLSVWREG